MEMKANKLKEEKIIAIDSAVFDNYTGKYRLNSNLVVTIFKENNKLFAQATDQPKFEMSAVSETDFVITELNAKISFVKGENGKATKMKLNMKGGDNDLPRIE